MGGGAVAYIGCAKYIFAKRGGYALPEFSNRSGVGRCNLLSATGGTCLLSGREECR